MTRFKFSFLYGFFIILTTPFHVRLEKLLLAGGLRRWLQIGVLAVLLALFLIALFAAWRGRRIQETAGIFLAALILSYLFFHRGTGLDRLPFSYFLHISEFFFMGLLIFVENKKAYSLLPFLILLVMAVGFEMVQKVVPGRIFDIQDIWINAIAGCCGMLAAKN